MLPIDLSTPYVGKAKYVGEETPMLARWFVFGHDDEGRVNVSNSDSDVFTHVAPATAAAIVEARNAFVDKVFALMCVG